MQTYEGLSKEEMRIKFNEDMNDYRMMLRMKDKPDADNTFESMSAHKRNLFEQNKANIEAWEAKWGRPHPCRPKED